MEGDEEMGNQDPWLQPSDKAKARVNDTLMPPAEGQRLWVVSLVERYEVEVWASSRQEAIEAVDMFGGNSPVETKITASPKR